MRNCPIGKACSATCINRHLVCRVEIPKPLTSVIGNTKDFIKREGGHLADHLGKNVVAWKAGKVLGGLVSSYLEGQYGIPREISAKLAETAIQGLANTGLDIKNVRNKEELVKKLVTEMAAAFIGKSAHSGAETFISAKEMSASLETALPILAGKFSGLGTALLASKAPSIREITTLIADRSDKDIGKIRQFLTNPLSRNFSEPGEGVEEIVGDIVLLSLMVVMGKMKSV